jgi:hypothetical protein
MLLPCQVFVHQLFAARKESLAMSDAAKAIANYLRKYIETIEDHFDWPFDEAAATQITGKRYPKNWNWYDKTVKLKKDLTVLLKQSKTTAEKFAIAKFYIVDWGGVKSNEDLKGTIKQFSSFMKIENNRDCFKRISLKGVSTWSKYISLCSDWAAIYDSRVAYSINAIRYIKGDIEEFFPIPGEGGQSPRLNLIDIETLFVLSLMKKGILNPVKNLPSKQFSADTRKQFHLPKNVTYYSYLKLLNETTQELGLTPKEFVQVEMLLFALAPTRVLSDLIKHISKTSVL